MTHPVDFPVFMVRSENDPARVNDVALKANPDEGNLTTNAPTLIQVFKPDARLPAVNNTLGNENRAARTLVVINFSV